MLLAELEIWHSRPQTPTRRVSLGHLVLPVDPAPGFGGLLVAAVIAAHLGDVDDDVVPDIHRLLDQVCRGERVVQPRLLHRYQVDRHGLAASVHRMKGDGERIQFELNTNGSALAQVLGALYAVERMAIDARRLLNPTLHRAMRWHGPIGPSFVTNLAGSVGETLSAMADPRAWALELLGFEVGTVKVTKKAVMAKYRDRLREAHPDHGGDNAVAADVIERLGEARKILLAPREIEEERR